MASDQDTINQITHQLQAQGLKPGTQEFRDEWQKRYAAATGTTPEKLQAAADQASVVQQNQVEAAKGPNMTGMGANTTNYFDPNNARLGGNPNNPSDINSFANNTNAALQLQGAAAQNRAGPQVYTGAVNMIAGGAGKSLGEANSTNYLGLGNAANLAGTATGAGYQGQLGAAGALGAAANGPAYQGQLAAANQLQGMAVMPTGPSVAQQQLQMGGDAAMRQQMAMASSARGGNTGLALQNAAQNQGDIQGNLNAQMGVQRAQEDMANRQFVANAANAAGGMYGQAGSLQGNLLGASGQTYGQAAGTQQTGYGAAGNALQGIANNQVGQANTQAGIANTYAGLATSQLGADMNQRTLNDQTMLASQGMGLNVLGQERAAQMQEEQNNVNTELGAYGINRGIQAKENAANQDWTHQIIGGTIAAAGAVAAPFTGGASLAAVPAGAAIAQSDIRAKKDIHPADADISNAYRALNADASETRGTNVQYPLGYSYEYKDPNAPGAADGTHYGPMAQDLEKTPAGASVVGTGPDGKKSIDTSRLSLLNASELAKQKAQIDALSKLFSSNISSARVHNRSPHLGDSSG